MHPSNVKRGLSPTVKGSASSSTRTTQSVRINSLREGSADYYPNATKLIRARRLAGTEEMRSLDVRTSGYLPF